MKNRKLFVKAIIIAVMLIFLNGIPVMALDVPALKSYVNDYADMISPITEKQLESALKQFEQQESTQLAILTIPSLKGDSLEDFSIRVAEKWKIGQKELDSGAILLIAKADRKIRIEVGYGLEGRLTDLLAGRIIQNIIGPEFKAGKFDQGILNGVGAMMGAVKGEFKDVPESAKPHKRTMNVNNMFFIFIVFIFLISRLGRISTLLGSITGGILLPVASVIFFSASLTVLLSLIPLGLFGGFFLSLSSSAMASKGVSRARSRSAFYGGFWGGSGFGGGSSGGFSGGMGGGFGGGGASGGW